MKMEEVKFFRECIRHLECHLEIMNSNDCDCCGVNKNQCFVLVEIGRRPGISVKEVAEVLQIEKSSMSRTVDSLVKKGYIIRQVSTKDRRYVMLYLTEKGQQHYERIENNMNELFERIFSVFQRKKGIRLLNQ